MRMFLAAVGLLLLGGVATYAGVVLYIAKNFPRR